MTDPTPVSAGVAPAGEPTPSGLCAGDVMVTNLITVDAEDGLLLTWELLCQAGVHHVPVLEGGRCIGLVAERDLALEVARNPLGHPRRLVREITDGEAAFVRVRTPLSAVAATLLRTRKDAILVHDDEHRLVGLLTVHDLLRAMAGTATLRATDQRWDSSATLFRLTPVLPAPEGPDPREGWA